jgi:hypothetical protein
MKVLEFLSTNGLTIATILACAILVATPERSPLDAGFGILIIYAWVYGFHRFLHVFPPESPLSYMNPHIRFHHQHDKSLDRHVELAIEACSDLFLSFSLLLVQRFFGFPLVPTSVIVLYALLYTSTHIFNYSIIGSETHRKHHMDPTTNFGPDTFDQLFGTSYDGKMEDLAPIMMNAIVATVAVLGLKQIVHWQH